MENSILKDKAYLSENQEFHEIQELDEEKVTYSLAEYDEVSKSALDAFGIKYLFPWQRIVISNILDSAQQSELPRQDNETENDIICNGKQIVLLPTGAGKSLCFLVPALLLKGPTLVLYPLLALMADQKRRMDEGNMKTVVFKGGQTQAEREENFSIIKSGAKIILANPEVLQDKSLVKRLAQCNIAHIAIDEAHVTSEWGDTFRPAYLTLGNIINELGVKTVTAFTATASPVVLQRISQVLFNGEAHIVRSDSDRPNIHYTVINSFCKKREAFHLAVTREKPLIIFCGTRKKSEEMARELAAYYGSDKVKFYHAGMEKKEKDDVEKWFYPKKDGILCCTCAFGMGVDKKDIKNVIHLEPSPTAESYIQEAGRGGRDGSIAEGILLWSKNDSVKGEAFPQGSRERVLKTFAESSTCRRQVLLDALGGEQAVCDGCDVCRNGKSADYASDGTFALNFIRKHRKLFTKAELISHLMKKLNEKYLNEFSMNVWTAEDVKEIIMQLELDKKIYTCAFPWKGKIDCTESRSSASIKKITLKKKDFLPQRLLHQADLLAQKELPVS
ncbi:MAG: RecQ family ATP-dependent DNA helicase [Treponema sp.]|nr:RecQ family ATP-dependent DNA helicase [Treponema sp.]